MKPVIVAFVAVIAPGVIAAQRADTLRTVGLRASVEVLRDKWGVNHIYAKNEHDLFFAQGYLAAKDRTFQFELWRRMATGTVAEVLGAGELVRDIGARLFRYRGNMAAELAHYHPHGAAIVGAYVDGVNAFMDEVRRNPVLNPIELKMLGITPGRWTPEIVVSRHGGLLGNITDELNFGRIVVQHGTALLREIESFHPGPDPQLDLDPAIDKSLLAAPILEKYDAFRAPVRFQRGATSAGSRLTAEEGSNNWVVSPRLSANGHAMMANDPHRAQGVPSLRYMVHLVAPGWNVIGGGEPTIPGVSIGHNEVGAWGLTVFETDGEDLYVYQTNPTNGSEYRYRGEWVAMTTERTTILVKGRPDTTVTLKYTRHGPVVYEDPAHHVAYAVRAAWLEPGGAPYMASLRMDQAKSWAEFRDACTYSNIPGENMVWADTGGTIGWQAVGIAPIRKNWSGLVPVPGDGRFEWAGFLPIKEKPHAVNPPAGFIATANNDLIPAGYPHRDAVGWQWADPYRHDRIAEVLGAGKKFTVEDMTRLQTDYLSLPARALVPLFRNLSAPGPAVERARQTLLGWNFSLDKSSVPAGIYEAWYRRLTANVRDAMVPAAARSAAREIPTSRIVEWLTGPSPLLGANPATVRDRIVLKSLDEAVQELSRRYGADQAEWAWGRYHHVLIRHPMSDAFSDEMRARFEVGPYPRGGDGNTPGATGGGENQTSGASFRIAVAAGAWDDALATNNPGQSGDPASPHYRDLFELWKDDKFFPVKYTRAAVEGVTEARSVLAPPR